MKIKDFGVEIWMNLYENNCEYNLAETCVESLKVGEVLELAGKGDEFFEELKSIRLGYGEIEGSVALRGEISKLYKSAPKLENITVTHGAIGANAIAIMTIVEPGDKVISVLPTYQQHYSIPESIGADVHILRLKEENGWLPDLNELRKMATQDTKLICINNPNNPSGSVMDEEMLKEIAEIARSVDAYLICDEAYRGLSHACEESFTTSIVDLYEKGISNASMSKTFSAAGVRLGWTVGPEEYIARVNKQRDYHVISCGVIDDLLATIILENKEKVMERNLEIARNNARLLDAWMEKQPLLSYVKPKGGTTAFIKYDIKISSVDLCLEILEKTGVMLLPGSALDVEGYLRMGYCNNPEIMEAGLEKLGEFFQNYEVK